MFGFTGLSFQQFFTDKNISQFGNFSFDFANVKGAPKGVVSADTLTFVLSASGLKAQPIYRSRRSFLHRVGRRMRTADWIRLQRHAESGS